LGGVIGDAVDIVVVGMAGDVDVGAGGEVDWQS
jgi:hypothetical protein